tara:strand:+ start:297 stop:1382 length:1086 start_codon:yes stop_codon:yes gene_type:complete
MMHAHTDWRQVGVVAGSYLALLVGGAFATGQEAIQFFVAYGAYGFLGLALCCLAMIYMSWSFLSAGRREKFSTNEEVFRYFCGDSAGKVVTWYTIIMIIAVYGVMLSGIAATLEQAYGIPASYGAGLMALCCMTTALLGLNRIVRFLGFVGPLVVIFTLITAIGALFNSAIDLKAGLQASREIAFLKVSNSWWISCFLYVGLATPGLAGFLPLVGATMAGGREVNAVAVVGPVLFIGALAILTFVLITHVTMVHAAEVPLMTIAINVSPLYGSVFGAVIFLGIYTTVTPMLWTICRRFAAENSFLYRILIVGITLICWIGGGLIPFGKLVNWIYPSVGYVGLFIVSCQIYRDIKRWRTTSS